MIDTADLRIFQKNYVEQHALDAVHYLMAEPRLGKTRAEVRSQQRRFEVGSMRCLVVAPQKPCELTWTKELAMRGIQHVNMHSGTLVERVERLRNHMASAAAYYPTVITVNYDVLEQHHEPITKTADGWHLFRGKMHPTLEEAKAQRIRSNSGTISDELAKWMPQDIIVDEAQMISSASSNRTNALWRLGRGAICRRLLSGTPDPNGSINLYAQMKFLDPTLFNGTGRDAKGNVVHFSGTRKADWLAQYAFMDPHGQMISAYRNEDEMLRKVFSISTRVRTKDVFGALEEVPPTIREIPWPPAARKLYDKLKKQHVLTTEDDGLAIDGTHKLTRMLRHQQLCSGFLVDQDANEIGWIHKAKLETLVSELGEIVAADKMCVVAYSFTAAGEAIAAACAAKYGADRVALVNGHTNERTANNTLRLLDVDCHEETPLRILVLQEQVGGMGISLARAEHMIFFSWSMDYNTHEQMRRRIFNEKRPALYTYLMMERSADGTAYAIIQDKSKRSLMSREFDFLKALDGELVAA